MPLPTDEQLATYTRLPLEQYPLPGPYGTHDRAGAIDWGTRVASRSDMLHVGDDVLGPPGTPVFAIAHGIVRYAAEKGSPTFGNWGWLTVVEHRFRDGAAACSIYGHATPEGLRVGDHVAIGQMIARITDYEHFFASWSNHLHFGVAQIPFGATPGVYPAWLAGYLASDAFPGPYVDPVAFCRARFPQTIPPDQAGRPPTPRVITTNQPFEGEAVFPGGDEDWFAFVGRRGQHVSFAVTRESGSMVPQLALFQSADGKTPGMRVAGDDANAGNGWRAALPDVSLPADGTYLVKIRGYGDTAGFYRFTKRVVG